MIRIYAERGVSVVPQRANTSMSRGATPYNYSDTVVISLQPINHVRCLDQIGRTISDDARVVMTKVQQVAEGVRRLFPLSVGAEGCSTIDGNRATNAGSVTVLRCEIMRELNRRLETVLLDGRIWDELSALHEDSKDYALCDLFVDSEGTLGIVTEVVIKFFYKPLAHVTSYAAVNDTGATPTLLTAIRDWCGGILTAFDFITGKYLTVILRYIHESRLPFASLPPAAVLIELLDQNDKVTLRKCLEASLSEYKDQKNILNATIAQDEKQTKAFRRVCESASAALVSKGKVVKHDELIPVLAITDFLTADDVAISVSVPGVRTIVFDHLGDGNLHYNILIALSRSAAKFTALVPNFTRAMHDEIILRRGSISSVYGIGQFRVSEIASRKAPIELEVI